MRIKTRSVLQQFKSTTVTIVLMRQRKGHDFTSIKIHRMARQETTAASCALKSDYNYKFVIIVHSTKLFLNYTLQKLMFKKGE